MRVFAGFAFALLASAGLFAQSRGGGYVRPVGPQPLPSVLRPGIGLTAPGATRTVPSVLNPGAAIGIPQARPTGQRRGSGGVYGWPVAVPVYVGGYGGYGYDVPLEQPPAQQQQQPNVIVVYPPAPTYSAPPPAQSNIVEVPAPQREVREERVEPIHYLIAFKDKSIYSAIAYWVDGDTIHYFTAGNTHNQASVSLIDRALTKRLNEGGLEVTLPAEK